jgi:uncharacterized protein YegL
MSSPDLKQVVRTIEGVVALCLGSSGRVVWVDQSDAAAFNDGDKVYLPAPTGSHPGEYDLLLAIALREVAKVSFSQAGHISGASNEAKPYAECVEEARLKKMLSVEYRGSPAIFDKAAGIAAGIFCDGASDGDLLAAQANRLAVWGAAHDAVLGTSGSAEVVAQLRDLALKVTPAEQVDAAIELARDTSGTTSTEESVALGLRIAAALRQQQPEPPPQEQPQEPPPQEQEQDAEGEAGANEPAAGDKSDDESTGSPGDSQAGDDEPAEPQEGAPGNDGATADEGDDAGDADGASSKGAGGGQDKAGDGSGGGDSASGATAQPGDSTSPGASSEEAAPEDGGDGQPDGDILSDALAKARGHKKARDVAAQAAELERAAQDGQDLEELTESQVEALRAALDEPVEPGQAVLVAAAQAGAADNEASEDCLGDVSLQLGGNALAEALPPGSNLLTGVPARLVSVLMREYQDKRRRPFQRGVSGQQIAVSQAWRLKAMGDVRVFRKRAPASGIDAAVSFLLDTSGSMDEVGIEAAAAVTYSMALAHQRIAGTQVSIDVFPGRMSESEQMLGFKQNLRAAEDRLKAVVASGGTPTGSAIAKRLTLLLATRSVKKVMYVITDGRPDPGEMQLTRHLVRTASEAGVIMIGVGINADVRDLFPISCQVSGVADLADALERLFKTVLVDRLAA